MFGNLFVKERPERLNDYQENSHALQNLLKRHGDKSS